MPFTNLLAAPSTLVEAMRGSRENQAVTYKCAASAT